MVVTSVAGWLTAAVGALHLGVAAARSETLSFDALWFAGSGLAVVLIGVLSLLAGSGRPRGGAVTGPTGVALARSAGLFVLAGVLEIGGGYLVWQWLRAGRPVLAGLAGAAMLAL